MDFVLGAVVLILVAAFATFVDEKTGRKSSLGCADKSLDKCLCCNKKCSYREVAEMIIELEGEEENHD